MAYSYSETVGSGATNVVSVPFPYLDKTHVKVFVDDVERAASSLVWTSANTIQLPDSAAALSGKTVRVQRVSPRSSKVVSFSSGSLSPSDLNTSTSHLLYLAQELVDSSELTLQFPRKGAFDAKGRRISNLGTPLESFDAATKKFATDYVAEYITARGSIPNENWGTVAVNLLSFTNQVVAGDWGPAINAATALVEAAGGGEVFIPSGVYPVATDLVPRNGVRVRGAFAGSTRLKVPNGNSTRNRIFYYVTNTPISHFALEDITFEGQWSAFQSELAHNGLVTLKYITDLRIERCHFQYSRFFALNINECDSVLVDRCRFEMCVRDMINVSRAGYTRITNNYCAHNDDDAIAVATGNTRGVVITGNHLVDTGGIRATSPKGVVIAHNTIERGSGGFAIGLFSEPFGGTEVSPSLANVIAHNTITDQIDRYYFVDGSTNASTLRTYIQIESLIPQTGGLAAVPGEPRPGGVIESPYGYNYSLATYVGNAGPARMPHGTVVVGNICKRTLPTAKADGSALVYSDWGFGLAYTKTGWVNHTVTDAHLRGIGVRVLLPQKDLSIIDNILEPGRTGISLNRHSGVALADRIAQGIVIRGNKIRDFDGVGVWWIESTLSHQEVTIDNNEFDGDPHFLHPARGAGGTWLNTTGLVALNIPYLAGALIRRNIIKNCASPITQTGVSDLQDLESNLIVADPAAVGYSASNKGVGVIPAIGTGAHWWLLARDCDPSSPTYGRSLGALVKTAGGMPNSGKWLEGMVVEARANSVTAGKMFVRFVRMTTGTGHVAGVDWVTLSADAA